MLRDIKNNMDLTYINASAPTDATAIVSSEIDLRNARSVMFAMVLGTMAATAITGTVLIEHADAEADGTVDDSSWAAVPDTMLNGTEAAAGFTQADDGETRSIGYVGPKPYVRITVTPTSNDAAMPIGIMAIRELLDKRPS
jgi:hypothetical protein